MKLCLFKSCEIGCVFRPLFANSVTYKWLDEESLKGSLSYKVIDLAAKLYGNTTNIN